MKKTIYLFLTLVLSSIASVFSQCPTVNFYLETYTYCAGSFSGYMDLSISGGTPPYTLEWNDGFTDFTETNISSNSTFIDISPVYDYGTITLTSITDANNCTTTLNEIAYYESGAPNLYWSTICYDDRKEITFDASYPEYFDFGPPYTVYTVVNGNNQQITLNSTIETYSYALSDEIYIEDIQDANFCYSPYGGFYMFAEDCFDNFILTRPTACSSNGRIRFTEYTSSDNWTFKWYKNGSLIPNSNTNDLSNIPAGIYTLEATNGTGYNFTKTMNLVETGSPTIAMSKTNSGCNKDNGTVKATLAGNYEFYWSNGAVGDSIFNLAPGQYTVTAKDLSGGCEVYGTVLVKDSCEKIISGLVFDDANTNGVQDAGEEGVSGITIQAGSKTTLTNPDGTYVLKFADYGTYDIAVAEFDLFNCTGTTIQSIPASSSTSIVLDISSPVSTGNDFALVGIDNDCQEVSGMVFNDKDENGSRDALNEKGLANITVYVTDGVETYSTKTNLNGSFSLYVPSGTGYKISARVNNVSQDDYLCTGTTVFKQTIPVGEGAITVPMADIMIGVKKITPMDVGVYTLRPDFGIYPDKVFKVWQDFKRLGDPNTDDCVLRIDFDPVLEFLESKTYTPTTVADDHVEWTFGAGEAPDFHCMEMFYNFEERTIANGMPLEWTATYTCIEPECDDNNSKSVTTYVRSNNILLKTGTFGDGPENMLIVETTNEGDITPADSVFSFALTTQNIGKDSLYHLVVRDTLSDLFDVNTVSTAFSSWPYTFTIIEPNILQWEFDDLKVPGSEVNFLESYGFLQYDIKTKAGMVEVNDVIEKEMYQVFNRTTTLKTPTYTETVQAKVNNTYSDVASELIVFPNPTTGDFSILIAAGTGALKTVSIKSVEGIEVQRFETTHNTIPVDGNSLPAGLYFVEVKQADKVVHSGKFIKH